MEYILEDLLELLMSFENLPSICVNSFFLGIEPAMICRPVFLYMYVFVSMNSL